MGNFKIIKKGYSQLEVDSYIERLKNKGLLTKSPTKNRAIGLTKKQDSFRSIPVVGTVTAGTPILAIENIEGYCPLPDDFSDNGERFCLIVKGDSMIKAGILNGDKIIVKKEQTANDGDIIVADKNSPCRNGDIVVGMDGDEATVKRLLIKNGEIIFMPENPDFSPIYPKDPMVLGKVIGSYRKY